MSLTRLVNVEQVPVRKIGRIGPLASSTLCRFVDWWASQPRWKR
jgi:hypothetical protein